MKTCSSCANEVADSAIKCQHCGLNFGGLCEHCGTTKVMVSSTETTGWRALGILGIIGGLPLGWFHDITAGLVLVFLSVFLCTLKTTTQYATCPNCKAVAETKLREKQAAANK